MVILKQVSLILGSFLCGFSAQAHSQQSPPRLIFGAQSTATFQGTIPPGLISAGELATAKVADLLGDQHESLVFKSSTTFRVFNFKSSTMQLNQELPYQWKADQGNHFWTTGDLNTDGTDEILYSGPGGFKYSQTIDKRLKFLDLPFSEIPDQFLIGDFGRWSENNLVVFSHGPSDIGEETGGYDLRLGLYYFSTEYSTGVYHLWCEHHAFNYSKPRTVPPNRLQTIGTVDASTTPFLIISDNQSDMSPTGFDFLSWDGERFRMEKRAVSFSSSNIVLLSAPTHKRAPDWVGNVPFIMGLRHLRFNRKSYLAAKIIDTIVHSDNKYDLIYRWTSGIIRNGVFIETGFPLLTTEFFDAGMDNPHDSYWINPDGNGPGILTLNLSNHRWKFVRAPTTPIRP